MTSKPAVRAPSSPPSPVVDAAADLGRAAELAEAADAPNTRRAYRADVADWRRYAAAAGVVELPIDPAALAAYVAHLDASGKSVATIRRRCSAIARLHRERDLESPTEDARVRRVLRGLARQRGSAPRRRKRAITPGIVRAAISDPSTSLRDRALLTVGFVSGLRRSELVALTWGDVVRHPDGLVLTVRRSKGDQAGVGAVVGVPYGPEPDVCPARALMAWKRRRKRDEPRVFPICAQTVANVVKRAARIAGEDPDEFAAHSLRAGLATIAAEAGVGLGESMSATRHRSADVAASYVRPTSALRNAAHRAAAIALAT